MLKIYLPAEIEDLVSEEIIGSGSSADVLTVKNGEVYKWYYKDKHISDSDLVSWEAKNAGITNLIHLLNLSKISLKSFCSPTGIVIEEGNIKGITMKKAVGQTFDISNQTLESLIPHENSVKNDIIELSKHFVMHDVGASSLFYDPNYGFSLVDLDYYSEAYNDPRFNNLFMFYFKILQYIPEVQKKIYEEFQKGVDFYRLEVALEVIGKYLREFNLTEEEIRLSRK